MLSVEYAKKISGITMGIQALGFFITEFMNLFQVFLWRQILNAKN